MSPNHRPYLRPGVDLITAEDVLAWQADCVLAWVPEHPGERMPAGTLVGLLRARLDRERRQACRRGALSRWRAAAKYIRFARAYTGKRWAWPEMVRPGDGDAEAWAWRDVATDLARCLSDALAYRAAARAKP